MSFESTKADFLTGLKVSLSAIVHEFKLSLCLVFTIAAIIAPLLLLFGLKFGVIETLSDRLRNDPAYRAIIPLSTRNYSSEFFEQLKSRPDIAFLIPATRRIAATVEIRKAGGSHKDPYAKVDIVPTAPGDVLILETGCTAPEKGQCVLSRFAAEEAGNPVPGDRLECLVRRSRGNRSEKELLTLEVVGILPDRAESREAVYVPLALVEAVEQYKDGRAVPSYGWLGEVPEAYPKYDGFVLVLERSLEEIEKLSLKVGTGLTSIREIEGSETKDLIGLALPDRYVYYLLSTERNPVGRESMNVVREKMRGKGGFFIPYVKQKTVTISTENGDREQEIPLQGCQGDRDWMEKPGLKGLPPFFSTNDRPDRSELFRIVLPADSILGEVGDTCYIRYRSGDRTLRFPATVIAKTTEGTSALAPSGLLGILNTLSERDIVFDPERKAFVMERMTHSGFRMYARSIFDVEPLRLLLVGMGIDVSTKAGEIERVRYMSEALSKIFWLIAVIGIAGCMAALVLSLVSSVERKKRSLGVMRLIGFPVWLIFFFPVFQAIVFGIAGYAIALLGAFGMGLAINKAFAHELLEGEQMTRFLFPHLEAAFVFTLIITVISSLFAARAALRIDPADALRDE